MKKIILSTLFLGLLSANAQEIKFGAKVGANLSTVKAVIPEITVGGMEASGEENKNSFAPGFHIGGFAEISFNDVFAFQPELQFSLQGSNYKSNDNQTQNFGAFVLETESTSETKLRSYYLNMPLLAKYKPNENLFFVLGPQVGYLLSAKSKYESQGSTKQYLNGNLVNESSDTDSGEIDAKSSFKSIDFGLAIGGGYFINENIFAEIRYIHGLNNTTKAQTVTTPLGSYDYEGSTKSQAIQLSLGYRF